MLMCALLIAVPVTTESASAAVATNRTAKAKISGWVTVQNCLLYTSDAADE